VRLSDRIEAGIGPAAGRLALAGAVVGVLALAVALAAGRAAPAAAALVASWLFFAGLSAGSVAVAAAVRVAHGRWAEGALPLAEAGSAFFAPALALLVVVLAGEPLLAPGPLAPVAIRLLLASAVVFALGARFVAGARRPGADAGRVRRDALVYLLAYAVGLSVWAHDLVLRLSAGPPFTVVPAYYFLGAFLSGLAWVSLVAALRDVSGPDLRHDLGKLLFGFIVVWSYLLWSLFLPTWYGNVPEEAAVLLRRWSGPWKPMTLAVLVAVSAWPFWLLFSERLKRRRATLAVGAATILLGLWGERVLLVVPSLQLRGGAVSVALGVGVALGVAGAFLLAVGARLGVAGPAGVDPPPPRGP
jgi:Ni/Fe-hydrogenase subunit HybB-like protein